VAAESCILTSVKDREPHELVAERRCILKKYDVLADGSPAPGFDLTCHVGTRHLKRSKLVAVDDAALAYRQAP
jgi:hypothetical protein